VDVRLILVKVHLEVIASAAIAFAVSHNVMDYILQLLRMVHLLLLSEAPFLLLLLSTSGPLMMSVRLLLAVPLAVGKAASIRCGVLRLTRLFLALLRVVG